MNTIAPQPTPMAFTVAQAELPNGQMAVALQVSHSAGLFIAFLSPAAPSTLGKQLAQVAGAGQLLVVAPTIPPGN